MDHAPGVPAIFSHRVIIRLLLPGQNVLFVTMSEYALGLIETAGLVAAIEAADAAAKAASVVVASAELTDATYMTLRIEGELGAVQAAVEAGARAAAAIGEVISVHVIPNADDGLSVITPTSRYASKYHPDDDRPPLDPGGGQPTAPRRPAGSTPSGPVSASTGRRHPPETAKKLPTDRLTSVEDLQKLSVSDLRRLARTLTRLELKGRQISLANKKQLIDAIKRVMDMD